MSSTRPSLSRLFAIHQAIAERSYPTLEQLAVRCDVTPRTIKRDLKVLREDFNAPLEYSREQNGYYYSTPFNLSTPPLSEGELTALCLMVTLSQSMRNTPFAPAIARSLTKLLVMLPEPVQGTLLEDGAFISCLPEPTPPTRVETAVVFNTLLHAIETHHAVRMVYYTLSRDAVSTRVVDPYHLYYRHGMWYLHGWCHLRDTTRDFSLERVSQVETLHTVFATPDMDAVRARLAQRFSVIQDTVREVAIWFDAETARRIRERIWHHTQQIDDHPDGACTLRMTVEGMESVARWILGFGRHARPLAPAELVTLVATEIRAMAAQLPPV